MEKFTKEKADYVVKVIVLEKGSPIRDEITFPCNRDSTIEKQVKQIFANAGTALHVRKLTR